MAPDSSADRRSGRLRWIEVFAAAWILIAYVHRLALDVALFGRHPSFSVAAAVLDPGPVLFFVLGFPLLLIATALRQETLAVFHGWLSRLASNLRAVVLDWKSYAAGVTVVVLAFLITQLRSEEPLWQTLSPLFASVRNQFEQNVPLMAVCLAVYGVWLVTYFLSRTVSGRAPDLQETVTIWSGSCFFLATVQVLALLVHAARVGAALSGNSVLSQAVWQGYLKDTVIYSLIATAVAAGLIQFGNHVQRMVVRDMWQAIAWIGLGALIAAVTKARTSN